jgi:hypothetical protein
VVVIAKPFKVKRIIEDNNDGRIGVEYEATKTTRVDLQQQKMSSTTMVGFIAIPDGSDIDEAIYQDLVSCGWIND